MRLRDRGADAPATYDTVTRVNHWLGAALVLAMLTIGLVFTDLPPGAARSFWRTLHIAIGTVYVPLVAFRLIWRWRVAAPPALAAGGQLARAVHGLLLVALVAMLASGVLMQWFGGRPIGVFDLLRIASPVPASEVWHERMEQAHGVLAWCLMGLIGVHLAAVLMHSVRHGRAFWSRMVGE
ncbi:cytochrome b [Massilia sp. DWR3-1-1]|uniref:cytochrome b n=1 Tax=Massilia sp. DWR3-1-1 TaxID=2804559 RepID=UPI003CF0FFCF